MKRIFITVLLVSILACTKESEINNHCYTQTDPPDNAEKVSIDQGVWGNVWFWSGNFMPPGRGEICQVERTLYFYEPATRDDVEGIETSASFYSEINTNLVATVESDADGFFQIEIEPGNYSVFVKENGNYYANRSGGDGQISPVELEEGTVTQFRFDITYDAVY